MLGVVKAFVRKLGRSLDESGNDPRSGSYPAQRISLAIQRGNTAMLMLRVPLSRVFSLMWRAFKIVFIFITD